MSDLEPQLHAPVLEDPSVTRLLLRRADGGRCSELLERAGAVATSVSVVVPVGGAAGEPTVLAMAGWRPERVMASQAKKFEHSVEYSAMYWNTHAEFVRDRIGLRPGEHDDRHIVVDLVEMAKDPGPTLEWAFEAVGLDTAPIDDLVERFPGDADRLDKWRHTLDPARQKKVEEYCFDQMRALGYEPELATGPRTIGRARKALALAREHGGELLRDPGSIRRKQVGRRVKAALKLGS